MPFNEALTAQRAFADDTDKGFSGALKVAKELTTPLQRSNNAVTGAYGAADAYSFINATEVPKFDMPMRTTRVDLGSGVVRSVRVLSCNFAEMVEQQPMGLRPFVGNVTNTDVMNKIPDIVRNNSQKGFYTAEALNPYINDIISISANTLGSIPIVNSWQIKRYSFAIKVEVVKSTGNTQNYLVEGFTDTNELSTATGAINVSPGLVLYVNNVIEFADRTNLNTGVLTSIPLNNYNIISKDPFDKRVNINTFTTQRPYDIANNQVSGLLIGNTGKLAIDNRATVNAEYKPSTLENNNPSTYVARIINKTISSIDDSNTDNLFNNTALRAMISGVEEAKVADNGFLNTLGKNITGYISAATSFTWKDLIELDPALANPNCPYLNVYPAVNRGVFLPSNGMACDDISGSGAEQVFASMIANSVSDLMAKCRATEVAVMASNHTGVDQADVSAMRCYDQNEIPIQSPIFERLFIANIMQMLNYNTHFAYNVAVNASIWGETLVVINLGYGKFTFLFPNFANSMYSPMLTNNQASTLDISRELLSVSNSINSERYDQYGFNKSLGGVNPNSSI